MPTYNASAVENSVIAFEKGITIQTQRALRDNPIAMAEGQAGAPRFAIKSRRFTESTGAIDYFSDGYLGCEIFGNFSIEAAASIDIEFSADGTTFPDSIEITQSGTYKIIVDFPSGQWFYVGSTDLGAAINSGGTMASIPADVSHVRFRATSTASADVILTANGGASAS